MAADMLTNLVRDLDDHDLSVLHTRNTQNGLVGVDCVNHFTKKFAAGAAVAAPSGHLLLGPSFKYVKQHENIIVMTLIAILNHVDTDTIITGLLAITMQSDY